MSRINTAREASEEDFSNVLGRFARDPGHGLMSVILGTDLESETASEGGPAKSSSTAFKKLAPKIPKKSSSSGIASLSYEDALRQHSRYRPAPSLDTQFASKSVSSNAPVLAKSSRLSAQAMPLEPSAQAKPSAQTPATSPKAPHRHTSTPQAATPISPRVAAQSLHAASKPVRTNPAMATAESAPAPASAIKKTRAEKAKPGKKAIPKKLRSRNSATRHTAQIADASLPDPSLKRSTSTRAIAPGMALSRTSPATALEIRSAVLSIRLSPLEQANLRGRAAEANLSVSAYMRSCVLEADQLRAQVKLALFEMRASMRDTFPERAPALSVRTEQGDLNHHRLFGVGSSKESGQWSRLLSRSAVLLVSPWLHLFRKG